ncbi:hypothetical protein [Hydrogenophaga sp.]|uniref:hypothetical protein n=1 Tax=Hydrogenophaga sp. TaxID=1904254 RepID=UPI003D14CEFB
MNKLRWYFSPQWAGWFLVFSEGTSEKQGYGPFMNDFEIQLAANIHGVPFTRETGNAS